MNDQYNYSQLGGFLFAALITSIVVVLAGKKVGAMILLLVVLLMLFRSDLLEGRKPTK